MCCESRPSDSNQGQGSLSKSGKTSSARLASLMVNLRREVFLKEQPSISQSLSETPLALSMMQNGQSSQIGVVTLASGRRRGEIHAFYIFDACLRFNRDKSSITLLTDSAFLAKNQIPDKGAEPVVIPALPNSLQLIFVSKDVDKEFGPNYTDEDATVDVSWKKNGKEIIPLNSDRMKINITRATSEDEGLYVCTLNSKNMQFKYSIIVFGTVEIVYVQMGSKKVFGRTIHDEITTAEATWTKNGKKVKSTHSERTKFKIVKATSEDEGSYVCTFGENNMQLTFSLVVVG
ncbi:unnamed protein product [Mytilus edulis]|uniref:Ig-like domain-containing protein n=1 Tax=Mytilus edulis TaxID=6550 RepID=A0A8S3QVD7_MYTED|nr:unnamed protein product [Mytilus edulis]